MIPSKRSHRSNRRGEAMVDERSSLEDGVVEESQEKRETKRFKREKERSAFDTRPTRYVSSVSKLSDVP